MTNNKTCLIGFIKNISKKRLDFQSRLVFEPLEELTIHSGCSQFLVSVNAIIIWVNRVKLCHIQALVNAAGDGLDVSNQLILNIFQVVAVI